MTRSKLGAMALLVAAFVLGALSGGAVMALADRGPASPGTRGERLGFVERLERDLALSPSQREAVQAVVERHRPKMDSLWKEVAPRFDTARAEVRQEINDLLTADQRQTFTELEARHKARRRGAKGRPRVP